MLNAIGICPNCGASGKIGNMCDYCCSVIVPTNSNYNENRSITSWSDFLLEGFSLVHKETIGKTDFPEYFVIKGNRTRKYGLINRKGSFQIPCIYDWMSAYLDYGICSVCKEGKCGVIDVTGKTLIELSYSGVENIYLMQYGLIIGFNSIYDTYGHLKVKLSSKNRILPLSAKYATTYPNHSELYNIDAGTLLLSIEYKIEKHVDDDLFMVSKVTNGYTRYGIYKADIREFILQCECVSIQPQKDGLYVARIQTAQSDITTIIRTITFLISNNDINIKEEFNQVFEKSSKKGCMTILIITMVFPLITYLLL